MMSLQFTLRGRFQNHEQARKFCCIRYRRYPDESLQFGHQGADRSNAEPDSGMVQRINKTCLKPDIGCFVLFDGGFSGLVVINFSAQAAMEMYESYMLSMGMAKSELASANNDDEVSNVMGEMMD